PAVLLASAVGVWGVVTHGRRLLLWTLAVLFALFVSGRDGVTAVLFPGAQNPAAYVTVSIWRRSADVGGRILACLPTVLLGLAAIWPKREAPAPNHARARWPLLACGLAVLVAANAGPFVSMRLRPGAGEDFQGA